MESFLIVFQLDPGGNSPDGLASCGIHHLIGPLVLQGRTRRLPPKHCPSTPRSCPPKGECRSSPGAWRAARRCTGTPGPSGIPSLLSCTGICGPPYRSPRITESVRVLSPQSRTRLLSSCSSLGRSPDRSSPSPGADTGGCRPPASPPAHWRRGRWRRAFRRGCAASRPCSGMTERTVSGLVSTPLRARAAWTLRYPQGSAGTVEDPLDQGAEPLICVVRVLMAASPSKAQYPDLDTLRQRHTDGDRVASCLPRWTQRGAPTGTLWAKEGSRFCPGAHLPTPGLPQPGAQPPAPRRPLRTDLGVHGLRMAFPPSPDPAPHRPKEPRKALPPRLLSGPFAHDLKDHPPPRAHCRVPVLP